MAARAHNRYRKLLFPTSCFIVLRTWIQFSLHRATLEFSTFHAAVFRLGLVVVDFHHHQKEIWATSVKSRLSSSQDTLLALGFIILLCFFCTCYHISCCLPCRRSWASWAWMAATSAADLPVTNIR